MNSPIIIQENMRKICEMSQGHIMNTGHQSSIESRIMQKLLLKQFKEQSNTDIF